MNSFVLFTAQQSSNDYLLNVVCQNLNVTRHHLLHDGWLKWRLSQSKHVMVYVALFSDIILLMQSGHDDKLLLRCQTTTLHTGRGDTRIFYSPVIRLRELLVRYNAAGQAHLIVATTAV